MPADIDALLKKYARLLRFGVVGGTAFVVQLGVTAALKALGCGPNLTFTGGFVCSTAVHYTLNRFWALRSERTDTGSQLGEYLATVALSYGINWAVFSLCFKVFGLGQLLSTALAVPPSTIVVFLILNYRVFKAKAAH